jgi:SAM-dependent methyltransferase
VDQSGEMLTRVRARARARGFADRVRTVQADLDVTWPALEPVDLVWASNFLHELANPGRVLKDAFTAIRPGGLLVVAEMDAPPRFLPHDLGLGVPGLEERCHDALGHEQADPEPRLGADWGPHLQHSGFAIMARRTFTINLTSPQPAATGRYAYVYLRRLRSPLNSRLTAGDLAALDTLLDSAGPGSVLNRSDLVVRGTRTAWIARRP